MLGGEYVHRPLHQPINATRQKRFRSVEQKNSEKVSDCLGVAFSRRLVALSLPSPNAARQRNALSCLRADVQGPGYPKNPYVFTRMGEAFRGGNETYMRRFMYPVAGSAGLIHSQLL